jgi:hypothetical protein
LEPRLRAAVAEHAGRWAVAHAAAGRAYVSDAAPDAHVDGTTPFGEPEDAEAVPAALAALLAGWAGPVLLVAADVPRLDDALVRAALGDLAAGAAMSFAPATDGRPYLLAFRELTPEALALLATGGRHRDEVFAAAAALGGEIGMLRSERRLVTPADARALAIDPLMSVALRGTG